jgi:hypothetical protein
MKEQTMTTTKQTFPAVTIEALPNGLLRLEDETSIDGIMVVDLHPVQVQALAAMVGFTMPDKSRAALARLSRSAASITKQAHELKSFLGLAVDDGVHVGLELNSAENIAARLDELLQDLEAIQSPDLEPAPNAPANPGGQMTLPV